MPLKSSEAFVLDVRKLQEADRLVTFFTLDEGKIRGVAASAARSRRRFGGRLERLSRVRVAWFEKEGRDLARIDGCDLLEESFTLHQDLEAAATLAYVAEVVDTFVHEREPDGRYFRLLAAVLGALRAGVPPGSLARYFEIWTLRLHGLMPDLARCGQCGGEMARRAAGGIVVRVGEMPAALCAGCRRATPASATVRLSPAAAGILESCRRLAPSELAGARFSESGLQEVESMSGALLTAFVGHGFRSSRFLKELVQDPAQRRTSRPPGRESLA